MCAQSSRTLTMLSRTASHFRTWAYPCVHTGDRAGGCVRALYNPTLSERGVLLCAARKPRAKDPLDFEVSPEPMCMMASCCLLWWPAGVVRPQQATVCSAVPVMLGPCFGPSSAVNSCLGCSPSLPLEGTGHAAWPAHGCMIAMRP